MIFVRSIFKIKYKFQKNIHNMSCFTQISNPITGKSEWQVQCENYDYHQEVARAAFADMLHDTERNQKYYAALTKTIKKFHDKGEKANVLDIGTGTGILSMMAVKSGADSVVACEAFKPMANCAEKIINLNGMSGKIKLIKKRSTDIKVGVDGDIDERANILVTEVFDTELIGEGGIDIFNHAHKHLLTENCAVIPDSSTVYAEIVESPLASSWNKPKLLANLDGDIILKTPTDIIECQGEPSVHDLQLSQFPISAFNTIVPSMPIFEFSWSRKSVIPKKRSNILKVKARQAGSFQLIFFWWDLKMDQDGEIILSCAPYWAHPDFEKLCKEKMQKPVQNVIPWRDHWMQGIYYLPKELRVTKDQEFNFIAYHDEYSFWFDAQNLKDAAKSIERLRCTCGFHLAYSRNRIGQINNNLRNKKYLRILEDTINKESQVLSISDGSLLGLATASLGAKSVICLEPQRLSREVIALYAKHNKLDNVKIVQSLSDIDDISCITHIVAEPYYMASIVPWDNFYFGTLLQQLKGKLNDSVNILPISATIYALPCEFVDLYKIRAPLGICEGFNLSIFDVLIEKSTQLADATVEAQPLWEYPCRALSQEQQIMTIDFLQFLEPKTSTGSIKIESSGTCNGIAIWVDWNLKAPNEKNCVTTGPSQPIEIGKFISWDMFTRQGVHLIPQPKNVFPENHIAWNIEFSPKIGEIKFKFNILD